MRRIIMTAALAAAALSFALSPSYAGRNHAATSDNVGVDDLGVDISNVNLSTAGVQKFLMSLTPASRRDVEAGCGTYNKFPGGIDEQTLAFCKYAT